MSYKNLTGLWASQHVEGCYSFKMSDEFKQAINAVPNGTYINLQKNKYKEEPKHPDLQMSYKEPEQAQQGYTSEPIAF